MKIKNIYYIKQEHIMFDDFFISDFMVFDHKRNTPNHMNIITYKEFEEQYLGVIKYETREHVL
jgi:hypothetical protein